MDDSARAETARLPLRERWWLWRDRLLANPRFQRWAAAFPPTRAIARRRAAALFDLCAGFVYSQVLLSCVRLRVFEILADGPLTPFELARRLGIPGSAVDRLTRAAIALDLLQRRSRERVGLGPLGAALLGNPGVAAMIEHNALLYADLADPVALLRGEAGGTALADYWPYAGSDRADRPDPARAAAYSALMATSQPLIADDVLDAARIERHRCLLDVGGGAGAFLLAAATRAPAIDLILFDLPPVADIARARFAAVGLAGRAKAVGGDFRHDPLPAGADVVSLVRVLHDHDDATVAGLLRSIRRALPEHGTLLVAEPMAGTPGAEAVGDAYFGFYLLAMGRGRARTPAELCALIRGAGFRAARAVATRRPMLTGLIRASV